MEANSGSLMKVYKMATKSAFSSMGKFLSSFVQQALE